MRTFLVVACVLLVAPAAVAAQYRGTTLSSDGGTRLVLHTEHGDVLAPRTEANQYGFQDPHISPDGSTAGWLELAPVEGIHDLVPGDLVLFRDGKVVREFRPDDGVIWAWAFVDGNREVAFVVSSLHTPSGFDYELHRVSDGRLLGYFSCGRDYVGTPPSGTLSGKWSHRGKVPAWVWPIAESCPVRHP